MNLPMIPGQNNNGKNGASVVNVPANTGMKTSPAAIIADFEEEIFPFPSKNIRCVFSITTIASSTIIPNPNNKANNTMKLSVTCEPAIRSAAGRNMNATNILNGTLSATKNALVTPMKNMRMTNTRIKPITIEFTRSLKDVLVLMLESPVITTLRSFGNCDFCNSAVMRFTSSLVSIKFSPARLMILSVITSLPSNRP